MRAYFLTWISFVLTTPVRCSLYDPHPFPMEGPFFEGWYMRITDLDNDTSVGLLFGSTLPESGGNSTNPLAAVSILWPSCEGNSTACKLVAKDAKIYDLQRVNITVNGSSVSKQPDVMSPPDFRWEIGDDDNCGLFQQVNGNTRFEFKLGELELVGEATAPRWWNKGQTGPEGWLGKLPLPLHWFVYSLGSNLTYFRLQNVSSGDVLSESRRGAVHLEKNWGVSFPKRWIWSQGVSRQNTDISYAISGGLVDLYVFSVDAYLIGYRNPVKDLDLNFRPDNSLVWTNIDGCSGSVHVSVYSLRYKLEMNLGATADTFSDCLLGPEKVGFSRACVESYDADAVVTVWKLEWFGYRKVDDVRFEKSALEFGGSNVCHDKCSRHDE